MFKIVRFDGAVDWEEEDRRAARGFKSRRKRKESKEMADRNHQARVRAVVEILYQHGHSTSLVALAQHSRPVQRMLDAFLDYFIDENDDDLVTRLKAFRNLPLNDIRDRQTEATDAIVFALLAIDGFFNTFRAYIPATVLSSSEDDDSPRSPPPPDPPTSIASKSGKCQQTFTLYADIDTRQRKG